MLRAERAKFFAGSCTDMVHVSELRFEILLVRMLGAGYARKLPRCCFACRNMLHLTSCACGVNIVS